MSRKESDVFIEYMRSKDYRVTEERIRIAEMVFRIHNHFTVQQLISRLERGNYRAVKSTVYRTLELMLDAGLVRKLTIGDDASVFEHVYGHRHHDHLVCISCGKIIEFSDEGIEELQDKVCERLNFEPVNHNLKISGYCRKCSGKREY